MGLQTPYLTIKEGTRQNYSSAFGNVKLSDGWSGWTILNQEEGSIRTGSIEQDADVVMFIYHEEYYLSREEPSRRAAECERDAIGRYTAAFMANHIGEIFEGRISGVSRFGLFVRLNGNGAEGLIPISSLPDDFYIHEEAHHRLVGRRSGRNFQLAQAVTVKLREADGMTGSTLFGLMGDYGPERKPHGGKPRGEKRRR